MTIALASAMDSLLHAPSPARMSAALGRILTELRSYDLEDWPKIALKIIGVLSNYCSYHVVKAKQEGDPFSVLSPDVATLSYISQELNCAAEEPAIIEGRLEHIRGLLDQSIPMLAAVSTQTVSKVLRFLEAQYGIFSSGSIYCVMAIPFVDLRCIAECTKSDFNIMYLNATQDKALLENMAFEFSSATLASDNRKRQTE